MEEGMLGLVRRGMVVWGNGEGVSNKKNTYMFPLHAAGHVRQVKLQIRRSLFLLYYSSVHHPNACGAICLFLISSLCHCANASESESSSSIHTAIIG